MLNYMYWDGYFGYNCEFKGYGAEMQRMTYEMCKTECQERCHQISKVSTGLVCFVAALCS